MKLTILTLLVALGLTCHSCLPLHEKEAIHVQYASQIRSNVMETLCKRHNMQVFGLGGGMLGSVYLIKICFTIKHPLTIPEARYLIIDCAEELIAAVNADETIRPYLKNYPFTYKNVAIFLFSEYPDGKRAYDPYIGVVAASYNEVVYSTSVPNGFDYLHEFTEQYEDAKELVLREYGGIGKPYDASICTPELAKIID